VTYRIADIGCGAGGAGWGYHLAGLEVTGFDIRPQPNYPFEFVQADMTTMPLEGFDAYHVSAPCQRYAPVTRWAGRAEDHPDLVGLMRDRLEGQPAPWVMENVVQAPLRADYLLCGSHFGLPVRRHRKFETSWRGFEFSAPCRHAGLLAFGHKYERAYADAMGCTWMTNLEGRQAIPPAYTQHIGRALLGVLG
jgi:hypothetical protein